MAFLEQLQREMAHWVPTTGGVAPHLQVFLAALLVYVLALAVARVGKKRFFGRNTVFDGLLAFMLGSVLSRAVNGDATLIATALAGFGLVGMHYLMGSLAIHSGRFGRIIKGSYTKVVEDGRILEDALRSHKLTRRDLEEAARKEGISDLQDIEAAFFERSGDMSFIRAPRTRVVEVQVAAGVQTVRLEIMS